MVNESRSIGKWISVIYRKFQVDINKVLKDFDLNSSQYIFLIELYKNEKVNQDYLVKTLHIDKSATARAIKQLELNGYVIREKNSDDKRAYVVSLTDKARAIESDLYKLLEAWNSQLTGSLDEETYDLVFESIKQMALDLIE